MTQHEGLDDANYDETTIPLMDATSPSRKEDEEEMDVQTDISESDSTSSNDDVDGGTKHGQIVLGSRHDENNETFESPGRSVLSGYGGADHEDEEEDLERGEGKGLNTTPQRKRGRPQRNNEEGSGIASRQSSLSRPSTPPPLEIPTPDGTPRGQFLHDLYSFMQNVGQPITKVPHLGFQELDLYRLYQLVISRGGMDAVTKKQEWKTVYQELGIPTMSTSASYNTRTNYKKYLYLYELENCDFNDRRPPGAEPHFQIGEFVRIVSSNYDGQVFYARIVKFRWRNNRNMYYVHYNGWSNSHDEWMPENVLSKLLPEEKVDPASLTNPHPNRSSKSNHIIGEPPPAHDAERSNRSSKRSSKVVSDAEEDEEEEDELARMEYRKGQFPQSPQKSSPNKKLPLKQSQAQPTRSLRLKLRSRTSEKIIPETTQSVTSLIGPMTERVRMELDKLEDEQFLDVRQKKNPVFLTLANLHRRELDGSLPGPFHPKLLQSVDLRVPNLDAIVGPLPLTQNPDDVLNHHDGLDSKQNEEEEETKRTTEQAARRESILAMKKELLSIKKEYRRKKKLLELYYGASDVSSSSSSSETSSTSGQHTLESIKTRTSPPRRYPRRLRT